MVAHHLNVVREPFVLAVSWAVACQRQLEVGLVDPAVASVTTSVQALGLLQVELLEDPSAHAMSASFLEVGVLLAVPRFPLAALAEPMDPTQDWAAAYLGLLYRHPAPPGLVPFVLQSCHIAQSEEEQKEAEGEQLCQHDCRRLHLRGGLQQLPTATVASTHLR